MKTIQAGKFKAGCLAIMDEVQATGEEVIVTKHGKPVVKISAASPGDNDIFGYMAGKVKIAGDLLEPAAPEDEWKALR